MSISLQELFEASGYQFDDLDDLYKVQGILSDAEDLQEEVAQQIEFYENLNQEEEEKAYLADLAVKQAEEEDY